MATLHLIRHSQASFGTANYDRLSDTGWQQSRITGRFLRQTARPGGLFRGSLQRHLETLAGIAESLENPPDAHIDSGFDEFDHLDVMQRYRPAWADPQAMKEALAREPMPRKAFQNAFVASVERWISGDYDEEYQETWKQFSARVWHAVENAIAQAGEGGDTIIVTSGGPVSVVMQKLLGLEDRQALELNAVLANAGITRVLYSAGERARNAGSPSATVRKSLASFNSTAHLELVSAELLTYR